MTVLEPLVPNVPSTVPLMLTPPQFYKLLQISERSFFRLKAAGRIGPECKQLGGSTRYYTAEVLRWIQAGCPDAEEWKRMNEKHGSPSDPHHKTAPSVAAQQ